MTFEQRKMEVMEMLLKVRSESLVKQMKELLKKEMIVGYTTAGEPLTLDQYNARLAEAEKQIARGETISHEELKKKIKKW